MHGIHHLQPGQVAVFHRSPRCLASDQGLRDNADYTATRRKSRIRHHAHKPHVAAAVDQFQPAFRQEPHHRFSRGPVFRAMAWLGAAEDADSVQQITRWQDTTLAQSPWMGMELGSPQTFRSRPKRRRLTESVD
jgi:hypothetical protein